MDFNITKQSNTNKIRLGDLVNKRVVNTTSSNNIPLGNINLIANPKKMSRSEDGGSVKSFNSADERSVMDAANLGSTSFNPTEFTRGRSISIASSSGDDASMVSGISSGNESNVDSVDSDDGSINMGSVSDSSDDESVNVSVAESEAPKSYDQILKEKQEILFKIERLGRYGIHPTKRLTMASSLEEIQHEYKKLRRGRDLDASIKFQRKVLIAVSGGVEFLNNRFDPIDAKLEGWSESLMENITDYDEVFEELYDKYNSKVNMAPELKLLMMIGGSAVMFHLSNTLFKSNVPGLNDILKSNPDIMRSISQAAVKSMGGGGMPRQGGGFPSAQAMRMNRAAPPPQNNVDSILKELNVPTAHTRVNGSAPVNFDDLSTASESERNTIRSSISKKNGRRQMNLNF
jgi:hypothetical protein